jgi:hypothetical protein
VRAACSARVGKPRTDQRSLMYIGLGTLIIIIILLIILL